MSDRETLPGVEELAARARSILEAHWQSEGYTVPNASVYPHQWLWDSCFHAIIWAHLGEGERAVAELTNVFAHQADDGFVPHMTYWRDAHLHEDFWGRPWTSCITQPPMYGHAIAELVRLGISVDAELVERARAALAFLITKRRVEFGLRLVHPWESGCDDSPRWDFAYPNRRWDPAIAQEIKGELVKAIRFDPVTCSPIGSSRFEVSSAAFNALVAFNAAELAGTSFSVPTSRTSHDIQVKLGSALQVDWQRLDRTWKDRGSGSNSCPRTSEALLWVLPSPAGVTSRQREDAFRELVDPRAFGGECGPAQVHRDEPEFDPRTYWRGPAWPQLTYLFWVAAKRLRRTEDERYLREAAIRGAVRSGFGEYRHPDTGEAFGAVPQSWAGLAAVIAMQA